MLLRPSGAAREPACEFWLHGTEGTLHLDVDNGQLRLALRSGALGWDDVAGNPGGRESGGREYRWG